MNPAPKTRIPKLRPAKTASDPGAPIGQSESEEAIGPAPGVSAPAIPLPRQTKAALLREMVLDPQGASLQALIEATGWQAHTVRAGLSGLRKSGLSITHERDADGPRYRVIASPAPIPAPDGAEPTRAARPARRRNPMQPAAGGGTSATDAAPEVWS